MGDSSKEAAETPPILSATASVTTTTTTDPPTGGSTTESQPPPLPPREHLIVTAVKFLNNPNIVRSAINKKQAFLRSKGLTDDEIQIACDRAGVFTGDPNQPLPSQTVISMGVESSGPGYATATGCHHPMQLRPTNFLSRMKDMLSSVAMLSGLMYGVYWFYKKFIEPLLFRDKKKKGVTEQLNELNQTVTEKIDTMHGELAKIKEELNRVNQFNTTVKNFKGDLDSIKGLLLNRKQFAAPNLPVVPPSIPAWQLRSQQHQQPSSEGEHDKNDDNDTGSGSGSSENDVVLKNSDSSLEIM
ncbi:peroxisomal membrane protein PEX14 isoform X2 [Anopheles cruzii]|uniref:peroxisomal membrane protein PEX14 isoform X2 n=1 Tax=Anopheles cruzii TaxID=68878 RepID=UPI0022EC44B5|nr:peroxisomal membrane protein PEX14 isoform X2 [Anopheles cruzii]